MSAVKVCAVNDVSVSTAVKVTIDGVPIALVKDSAGDLHAIGDTCSHGEISLAEGFVEETPWNAGPTVQSSTLTPANPSIFRHSSRCLFIASPSPTATCISIPHPGAQKAQHHEHIGH